MTLETYREKRDFSATPEPKGRRGPKRRPGGGNSFVVQKHDATRLHYDFRLEMEGVLKSWAVTRGPSLVAGERRLAVHVEDHPLEYGAFEGTIPAGAYGGGTVMLWDRGTWEAVGDAAKGYAKGHLEFTLAGEKLAGRWHLVRMQGKARETRENWLLIKAGDAAARPKGAPDLLAERPLSVKTGRDLDEIARDGGQEAASDRARPRKAARKARKVVEEPEDTAPAALARAPRAPLPEFVAPMLATLVAAAPQGARWLHEIKFDGYRLLARIEDGAARLLTRSGLDWSARFGGAVTEALAALPVAGALLDGEMVVETDAGASDFSALQADLAEGRSDRFRFQIFDLLWRDGRDLRPLPLVARKEALADLLAEAPEPLRYSGHFDESGGLVLRHACRLSLEGIVSKLRDAPYAGGRGRAWVKSKCAARQEFVIGGYVPASTGERAVGSLVLGVHEGGALVHVGRVGTGFSARVAADLFERLEAIARDESPFAGALTADQRRGLRFVRPDLVAEVEFRAWTADGQLRHAAFRGLREDKPAREIVREAPEAAGAAEAPPAPKRRVALTHPDRLYWPDEGITKEGLADYHAEVWRRIAPFVVNRPLALLRLPTGIAGQRFFQKHAWKGMNARIARVVDPRDRAEPLVAIRDLDGLMGLVQAAALEIHPWGVTLDDWERPDTITMDLDPAEDVPWERVIDAARELRQRLTEAGLAAFVKTSGGKGLHVVAPLKPDAGWPAVRAFAKGLAAAMAADSPDLYVATVSKARRRGRILIDWLRNQRGATAVAAYSPRARPGAPVSTPLGWEELGPAIGPATFTVGTLPPRLAALDRDPWDGFRAAAVPLGEKASRRRRKASASEAVSGPAGR